MLSDEQHAEGLELTQTLNSKISMAINSPWHIRCCYEKINNSTITQMQEKPKGSERNTDSVMGKSKWYTLLGTKSLKCY